jgi:hypothetical protein
MTMQNFFTLKRVKGSQGTRHGKALRFCRSFRILLSLGFGDREVVALESLHSGCKLRNYQKMTVMNRHLSLLRPRWGVTTMDNDVDLQEKFTNTE